MKTVRTTRRTLNECGVTWVISAQQNIVSTEISYQFLAPNVLACENIRFSSLFAAGDVSGEERGETDVFAGYERSRFEEK